MPNTSYNHDCHLASQFQLEPNDYEVLLVVACPALYTRFGFGIKPMAWRKFLGGHQFAVVGCAIELEQKQIDINAIINGTTPSRMTVMATVMVAGAAMAMAAAMAAMVTPPTAAVAAMVKAVKTTIN